MWRLSWTDSPKLTWLDWVLDADHRRPVPAAHALQHLVLGQVGASVLHPDTRLHVVEVAAVQLEKLNEEEAQVDVGAPRVDPRVQLSPVTQEAAIKECTHDDFLNLERRRSLVCGSLWIPAGSWWPSGSDCRSRFPPWRPHSGLAAARTASGWRSAVARQYISAAQRHTRQSKQPRAQAVITLLTCSQHTSAQVLIASVIRCLRLLAVKNGGYFSSFEYL